MYRLRGSLTVIKTSFEQWIDWAKESSYTMLPVISCTKWKGERGLSSVPSWEAAWEQAGLNSFVLESGKAGRYTILGLDPYSVIRGTNDHAEVWTTEGTHTIQRCHPLQAVKQWMRPYRSPKVADAPRFIGGCVGFWGYDVARSIERLPEHALRDVDVPDYAFALYDRIWIIDHEDSVLYTAVHKQLTPEMKQRPEHLQMVYEEAEREASAMVERWQQIVQSELAKTNGQARIRLLESDRQAGKQLDVDIEAIPELVRAFSREEFEQAVRQIQTYIGQGDVFQVNLSVRQSRKLQSSPESIYEWLRLINPSPYMGLLRFSDFTLVSGSPELLVRLEDSRLGTRPIAGTRPRGATVEEDLRMADELISNEKERAEHVMLVDLERNDLGKISEYGSVKVDEFMVIEYYSHVMHIVSQVNGRLAGGKDAFDVIAAAFPGGTITGAPKVRTMEIIEELEPVRRGPYTGSIGWIDYNGDMEFNIIIRTLLAKEGIGYVQAGAGIVIDSEPSKEYTESLNKAKAVWRAVQYSEQMMSGA